MKYWSKVSQIIEVDGQLNTGGQSSVKYRMAVKGQSNIGGQNIKSNIRSKGEKILEAKVLRKVIEGR